MVTRSALLLERVPYNRNFLWRSGLLVITNL